jgi:hypothetical protein
MQNASSPLLRTHELSCNMNVMSVAAAKQSVANARGST